MVDKVLFSSASDEWSTPADLFNKLDAVFHFDLDPCATDGNHKCAEYFTKAEDGLTQAWSPAYKSVFINPPYSQIAQWVEKAGYEAHGHAFDAAPVTVMLIPSRTDTRWFHGIVRYAQAIYFIKGRVKFVGGKHSAPFPSMVVVFGSAETPEIEGMLRAKI